MVAVEESRTNFYNIESFQPLESGYVKDEETLEVCEKI
jgi:hypothetical protein